MRVLVDPMWGAGAGWIPRLLAGGRIRVTEIHSRAQPVVRRRQPGADRARTSTRRWASSPGGGYDLGPAARRRRGPRGRGRRARHLHPPAPGHGPAHVLPRRASRPARSRSSSTVNETSMAGGWASATACRCYETPVGFKYVGPKMIETGAMMGGEESGGYGFGMHLPERDGIYADLMLLDLFIRETRGRALAGLARRSQHLHEIAGPSFYLRIDVHVDRATYPALKDRLLVELREQAPAALAGQPVVRTRRPRRPTTASSSGSRDGSWLLVRFSGTEPLVRVYAEATSADAAGRAAGRRWPLRDGSVSGAERAGRAASSTTQAALARLDQSGMLDAAASLPGQVRDAWARSRTLELPARTGPRARWPSWAWAARPSAVTWWGASGPTGCGYPWRSCAATICRPGSAPRPSSWPAPTAARPRRPSVPSARRSSGRCPVAIISTGGTLLEVARRASLPHLSFTGGGQPRAAVGYAADAAGGPARASRHAGAP